MGCQVRWKSMHRSEIVASFYWPDEGTVTWGGAEGREGGAGGPGRGEKLGSHPAEQNSPTAEEFSKPLQWKCRELPAPKLLPCTEWSPFSAWNHCSLGKRPPEQTKRKKKKKNTKKQRNNKSIFEAYAFQRCLRESGEEIPVPITKINWHWISNSLGGWQHSCF